MKILYAEDEKGIREAIAQILEIKGHEVTAVKNGAEAVRQATQHLFEMIILDVMMPEKDGLTALKEMRDSQVFTPVILLTAKTQPEDIYTGFENGADDYITKPFEMKEVLARIEAVLRRTSGVAAEKKARRLTFDKLTIDMDAFELTVDGNKVDTPPKEMELLYYLASSPNRVYTRNQLLDEVWGFDYFGDSRTVDVHVKRLREKLEVVSENWSLKTVWGVGYKFEVL